MVVFIAFALGCWFGWRTCLKWLRFPDVFVRAQRATARAVWRRKSRYRGGRPRIDKELRELIRRLSLENPLWGAPQIHGELLKNGYRVAQSTVSRYMTPRAGRSTLKWKTFLRNHAEIIVAIDTLTVWTLTCERLYVVVVLAHDRRTILRTEATFHPTARWLANQMTDVFQWE